jgi:nicotinate-nucleotide adenylyltransferase
MTNIGQGLAILGGTFDPIHCGHLASAKAVRKSLGVTALKLIPSFIPPHRDVPGSTAEQRLAMLKIAIADVDGLEVDDRELVRQGVSYTVDTLDSFRAELGQTLPLYFVLGFDSYCTLHEWKHWQEITRKCHLVVLARPGYEDETPAQIVEWSKDKMVEEPKHLMNRACGGILTISLIQVDVSATELRKIFKEGKRPTGKMPEKVIDYAIEHELYSASS